MEFACGECELEGWSAPVIHTLHLFVLQALYVPPFVRAVSVHQLCRPSDLTLADFWGWEKVDPAFNSDDKGCSLVLVNTEQGRRLFGHVEDELNVIPTDEAHAVQPNLQRPSTIDPSHDAFERDYERHGFRYVMNRYGDTGWRLRLRRNMGRVRREVLNFAKNKK